MNSSFAQQQQPNTPQSTTPGARVVYPFGALVTTHEGNSRSAAAASSELSNGVVALALGEDRSPPAAMALTELSNTNVHGRLLNPSAVAFVAAHDTFAPNSTAHLLPAHIHTASSSASESVTWMPAVKSTSPNAAPSPLGPTLGYGPASCVGQPTVLSVSVPPRQRNKGVLCKQFLVGSGSCPRAHECPFLHVVKGDTRPLPESVCAFFRSSSCLRDTCRFFHGTAERLAYLRALGHSVYRPEDELEIRTPPAQVPLETTTIVAPVPSKTQSHLPLATASFSPPQVHRQSQPHLTAATRLLHSPGPPPVSVAAQPGCAGLPLPAASTVSGIPSLPSTPPTLLAPVAPPSQRELPQGNSWTSHVHHPHPMQAFVMPQSLVAQQQQQQLSPSQPHHQLNTHASSFVTTPAGVPFQPPHDPTARFPLHPQQNQQWQTFSLASPPPGGGVVYSFVGPPYVQDPVSAVMPSSPGSAAVPPALHSQLLPTTNMFSVSPHAAFHPQLQPHTLVRDPNTLGWYAQIM